MEHKDIKYFEDYELKKHTTFKIGGCARKVWFPKTEKEFAYLLSTLDNPVVLGGCSNVLISSAGIDRDVILTTGLRNFSIDGFTITADCGVKAPMLSIQAQKNGLSGFEFMIGFPGTVGGIIRMNASAHSQAVSDTCINAKVFDMKTKSVLELSKNELEFKYRSSILGKKNYILLSAKFELTPDDKDKIQALMDRNKEFRRNKQPNLTLPNAGSTFKNPPGDSAGRLLELAGAKTISHGAAKVWSGHANFVINTGNATSKDISHVINKMYNMVKEKYTIELEPEVKFIGIKDREEEELWNTILKK